MRCWIWKCWPGPRNFVCVYYCVTLEDILWAKNRISSVDCCVYLVCFSVFLICLLQVDLPHFLNTSTLQCTGFLKFLLLKILAPSLMHHWNHGRCLRGLLFVALPGFTDISNLPLYEVWSVQDHHMFHQWHEGKAIKSLFFKQRELYTLWEWHLLESWLISVLSARKNQEFWQ